MGNKLLLAVHRDLLASADETTRKGFSRFFKEDVDGYGVKSPMVRRISRQYFAQIRNREKQEIWKLCEALLETDRLEDSFIAFDWAYLLHTHYTLEDFELFEHWIARYVNNWAKCDTFCNHAIGSFLEKFPSYVGRIKGWTTSDNLWFRRAAAVSLVVPARKGLFLLDILDIADRLLLDKEDLVQKGYGWMLKEASKQHEEEIFIYVMHHQKEMPRTALRYAIEKMSPEMKRQAMEK